MRQGRSRRGGGHRPVKQGLSHKDPLGFVGAAVARMVCRWMLTPQPRPPRRPFARRCRPGFEGEADMQFAIGLIVGLFVGGAAGAAVVYFVFQNLTRDALARAKMEADQVRETARLEAAAKAREIELAARADQAKLRAEFEHETDATKAELKHPGAAPQQARGHPRPQARHPLGQGKAASTTWTSSSTGARKSVRPRKTQLDQILAEQRDSCWRSPTSPTTRPRKCSCKRIEDECKHEAGELIQKITEQAQEEAKDKAGRSSSRPSSATPPSTPPTAPSPPWTSPATT